MPAAAAPSTVTLLGRVPTPPSSGMGPVLLVVGNCDVDHLAMHFVASRPGTRSLHCAHACVVGVVRRTEVDLILLDVDASLMAGFVLAAHIRAADRARDDSKSAAIVATTSSLRNFRECHAGGSAIAGVLKMPCNARLFADFVDRWCLADEFAAAQCDETSRLSGHWR